MGRKRNGDNFVGVLTLMVTLMVIAGIAKVIEVIGWDTLRAILSIIVVLVIARIAVKYINVIKARIKVIEELKHVVCSKIDVLARRRTQLLQPDQYGKVMYDKWNKEIEYFLSTNFLSSLDDYHLLIAREIVPSLSGYVEEATASKIAAEPPHQEFRDDMSPTDYENYCAEELRGGGWQARVTMANRDQGVDVVAEKAGIRVVVQCKLYKSPVGNKAVQEISAARMHERADYAVVVTNNSFTSSANELAKSNDVFLLHHRDLSRLDRIFGITKIGEDLDASKEGGCFNTEEQAGSSASILDLSSASAYSMLHAGWSSPVLYIAGLSAISLVAYNLLIRPHNDAPPSKQHVHSSERGSDLSKASTPELKQDSPSHAVSSSTLAIQSRQDGHIQEDSNHKTLTTKPIVASTGAQAQAGTNLSGSYRCKPTASGEVSLIDITMRDGSWSVVHLTKKGSRIERAAQYLIKDTSSDGHLSWEGIHQRNSALKMEGRLLVYGHNQPVIYNEQVFDAKNGKVAETNAKCDRLP